MDGIYNATGRLKEEDVDIWVMNERTDKIKINVRSPKIKDLGYRVYDGHGRSITGKFSAFVKRVRRASVLERERVTLAPSASKIIEEQFEEFAIAVWSPSGITGDYSLTLQTYSEHSHKKIRSSAMTLEGKGMSPTLRKKGFFWLFTDYRYHPDES